VYEELKRLAITDGEGPPAKLRLGVEVLACDPEEGTITLDGGEVVHADLVLGADGAHVGPNPSPLNITNKPYSRLSGLRY
jgi:salicylate hydroxylase